MQHLYFKMRGRGHILTAYSFENDDESGQRLSQQCERLATEAKVEEPPAGSKGAKWEWSCASCLCEESVKAGSYEPELVRQSGLRRVFKTACQKVASRYRPSVFTGIWKFAKIMWYVWSEMAALWPRKHQWRWSCEGSVSCYMHLTCLHSRQGFSKLYRLYRQC